MCYSEKPGTLVGDASEIYSINILDKKWDVVFSNKKDDPELKNGDGYTFIKKGARRIIVDKDSYLSTEHILRHEIIHAFLYESGLDVNSHDPKQWACDEEVVDWIAIQFPKMNKTFEELNIL